MGTIKKVLLFRRNKNTNNIAGYKNILYLCSMKIIQNMKK